jgi:hypothetical protein
VCDSLIVVQFQPLFEKLRAKRWALLWRGSRDGFCAAQFHRRCDGRANTLTLICGTDGNGFGGFTPAEWESGWKCKCDDSLCNFLFTLRKPRGVPARKFALRAERKQRTIFCPSASGPVFDCGCGGCHILISETATKTTVSSALAFAGVTAHTRTTQPPRTSSLERSFSQ